jgi:hypothetical protein
VVRNAMLINPSISSDKDLSVEDLDIALHAMASPSQRPDSQDDEAPGRLLKDPSTAAILPLAFAPSRKYV